MTLTMQTLITNRLLDELANVFSNSGDADWLLWAIGYPPAARPQFETAGAPLGFWSNVCTQIDNGTVVGGFEPLLAAAAGRFPGNERFSPFAVLRRPRNQVLLDEIARVANDDTTASLLLAAIGFPIAALPKFNAMPNSLAFWLVVFEQIENGRIQGGFDDLIAQATTRFPGNQVLAKCAADLRTEPTPPSLTQAIADNYEVFISYSSRDKDMASRLAEALRAAGLSVWFDEWSIPVGAPFARTIQDVLARIRSVVVVYGSEGYGPWQQAEVEAIFDRSFRGDCRIIPVMLPSITPQQLPLFLQRLNGVRVSAAASGPTDSEVIERLVEAISTDRGSSQ